MIFGYLTYRNIRQATVLAEQQANRQVIKMVLLQIILIIISNTPVRGLYMHICIDYNWDY